MLSLFQPDRGQLQLDRTTGIVTHAILLVALATALTALRTNPASPSPPTSGGEIAAAHEKAASQSVLLNSSSTGKHHTQYGARRCLPLSRTSRPPACKSLPAGRSTPR
jgi:hypothetical protein